MYTYRLVTRDGIDDVSNTPFVTVYPNRTCELNTVKWMMNEWRVVSRPRLETKPIIDEIGNKVPGTVRTPANFATNAKKNYEEATITHAPSKGEVLGLVYRSTNPKLIQQIKNPYASDTAATTNKLPSKSGSSGKSGKQRTQRSKEK